ncbi:hypothetical protein ACJX0J_003438 [Zea mays]
MGWELCLDPREQNYERKATTPRNRNHKRKTFTMYRREKPKKKKKKGGNFLLKLIEKTPNLLIGVKRNRDREHIGKQAIALTTPGNYIEAQNWVVWLKIKSRISLYHLSSTFKSYIIFHKDETIGIGSGTEVIKKVDLLKLNVKKDFFTVWAGLFVCLVRKEEDLMIIRSSEPEVKIAVDRDPI